MVEVRKSIPVVGEPGNTNALNAESRLGKRLITPLKRMFRRSNFPYPEIKRKSWRLTISGKVENPLELSYRELKEMPAKNLVVTMECAGNGRSQFQPPASGERWKRRAVSTGRYKGVPLADILAMAKLGDDAKYLVFTGADKGEVDGKTIPFARRLRIDELTEDILLAYKVNGRKLPQEHGGPVRLVVPGWYGMASVKWITSIRVESDKPELHFNDNRYVKPGSNGEMEPVTVMQLRSLIINPQEGSILKKGKHKIRGVAWSSPQKPVKRVEVSTDGGKTWEKAKFVDRRRPYAWRRWKMKWKAVPGEFELATRAIDNKGGIQPEQAMWNKLGYENNSIQKVPIRVF